jgi:hypothetical protein
LARGIGPHLDLDDHAVVVVQSRVHTFTQRTAMRDGLPVPRRQQKVVDLELPVAHDNLVAGRVAVHGLHVRHMDRAFGYFALASVLNFDQAIGVRRRKVPLG